MVKVGVIGAGKWGSALAFALSQKCEVYITSRTHRDLNNFISLDDSHLGSKITLDLKIKRF